MLLHGVQYIWIGVLKNGGHGDKLHEPISVYSYACSNHTNVGYNHTQVRYIYHISVVRIILKLLYRGKYGYTYAHVYITV